jgi:hypothetical protein
MKSPDGRDHERGEAGAENLFGRTIESRLPTLLATIPADNLLTLLGLLNSSFPTTISLAGATKDRRSGNLPAVKNIESVAFFLAKAAFWKLSLR